MEYIKPSFYDFFVSPKDRYYQCKQTKESVTGWSCTRILSKQDQFGIIKRIPGSIPQQLDQPILQTKVLLSKKNED